MLPASEIEFRRATLALAADPKDQIALFPPFVCFGDELVIDWSEALNRVRAERRTFSVEEERAVAALDHVLTKYSGSETAQMFSDAAALFGGSRWIEIRTAAAEVCRALSWSIEVPWPSGAIYISKEESE